MTDWRKKSGNRLTKAARNIQALQALLPRGKKREELITQELELDAKRERVRAARRELGEDKEAREAAIEWRDREEQGEEETPGEQQPQRRSAMDWPDPMPKPPTKRKRRTYEETQADLRLKLRKARELLGSNGQQ